MGIAFLGTTLLTLLLFVWLIVIRWKIHMMENLKRQDERERRDQLSRTLRLVKWGLGVSVIGAVVTASLSLFGTN